MESKTVVIPNISCGHCVHTIVNEIGDLSGVKAVKADEKTKKVTIEWADPATWQKIEAVLKEINYPPQPIREG